MTRRAVIALCVLAWSALPSALAQRQLWLRQFGSPDFDRGLAVTGNGAMGAFVAGETDGSLGAPNAGEWDAWIARCDESGNRLWTRQIGSPATDSAWGLAGDGAGGVFVAGPTYGSLGGPSAGDDDVWLARYDSDGNRLWLIQFGTPGAERPWTTAADRRGGVLLGGEAWGSLGGPHVGDRDAWIARYDAGGNRLWVTQFGTPLFDRCSAVTPDDAGGFFAAGFTSGSLGGTNAGEDDPWLARYDSDGNRLWITQFGTPFWERAAVLALDGSGGVFVAGYTFGSLGGPSAGQLDIWLARYDAGGNRLWITQLGSPSVDWPRALIPDGAGGVFAGGSTYGSLAGTNAGWTDAWLGRFNADGTRLWIRQFGTEGYDRAWMMAPDAAGGLYLAGETGGSLGGPSAGNDDAWLARWTPQPCPGGGPGACSRADWNEDGVLDFNDLLAFMNDFNALDPCTDLDADGAIDFNDLLQFLNHYNAGC